MKDMNILVFFLFCCLSSKSIWSSPGRYYAIFNFGDSHSDTGNFLPSGALAFLVMKKLPYGETFFHHATSRCLDGCLTVDFIAEAFGLPYLPPYLAVAKGHHVHFRKRVNFAVVGATAIDSSFFSARKIVLWTNHSLRAQLGWFRGLKSSLCTTKKECDEYFKKSLFLVEEIGENEYDFPFLFGRTIKQLHALVPPKCWSHHSGPQCFYGGALRAWCGGGGPYSCNMSTVYVDCPAQRFAKVHRLSLIGMGFTLPKLLIVTSPKA